MLFHRKQTKVIDLQCALRRARKNLHGDRIISPDMIMVRHSTYYYQLRIQNSDLRNIVCVSRHKCVFYLFICYYYYFVSICYRIMQIVIRNITCCKIKLIYGFLEPLRGFPCPPRDAVSRTH